MQPSDAISATFTQTPRVTYKISRLSVLILTLFIIVLTVVGLNWLQYASQAGLTAGYPKPTVHITPSTSGTLLLRKPITFQAQGAGRDVTYSWSFDDTNTNTDTSTSNESAPPDGGTAQGPTAIYAYQTIGTHTITVIARDGINQISQTSLSVNVMPPLPIAHFTAQTDTTFGYDVSFDASSSSADPSTPIQSYQWDFGDGTMYTSTYYSEAGHPYAQPGTYTVTLIVVDQLNQSSQPFTTTITINANNTSS